MASGGARKTGLAVEKDEKRPQHRATFGERLPTLLRRRTKTSMGRPQKSSTWLRKLRIEKVSHQPRLNALQLTGLDGFLTLPKYVCLALRITPFAECSCSNCTNSSIGVSFSSPQPGFRFRQGPCPSIDRAIAPCLRLFRRGSALLSCALATLLSIHRRTNSSFSMTRVKPIGPKGR